MAEDAYERPLKTTADVKQKLEDIFGGQQVGERSFERCSNLCFVVIGG